MRWLLVVAVAFLASGCAWIGAGDRADRLGELDEDGDGVKAADEVACGANGDLSPNRFPTNPEIPYDGIDNDCQGGDLIDRDGDGFPGITEEEYAVLLGSVDPIEAESWPTEDFAGRGLDCNDEPGPGNSVNPGVANDGAYDCSDANCDGLNEFDLDGDDYLKAGTEDQYACFLAATGYDFGELEGGDCNDSDEAINPGVLAADDDWYDGKDNDCKANNDFDADGDGYYPREFEDEFNGYLGLFRKEEIDWDGDLLGDCWDSCDASVAPATLPDTDGDNVVDFCAPSAGFDSSDVHFKVQYDASYDGIDADCAGDNDFDQDGDGFSRAGDVDQVNAYLGYWGLNLLVMDGDCNDQDALVHPGQQEILDGQDQDCFGDVNSDNAAFRTYEGAYWTNVGQVEVAHTDIHWALSVPADHVVWPVVPGGASDNLFLMYGLVAGTLDPTIRSGLIYTTAVFPGNDLVAEGEALHVGTTYATTSNSLAEWLFSWNPGGSYDLDDFDVILFEGGFAAADDVSVLLRPNGDTWTVGCGDGVVYGVENFIPGFIPGLGRADVADGLTGASTCIAEDDGTGNPAFTVCNSTTCVTYSFDAGGNLAPVDTVGDWATDDGWARIERYGDTITLVPVGGTGVTVRGANGDVVYFAGETVLAATAAQFGGDTVIAAVVAGTPNIVKLFLDNGDPETAILGFLDPDLIPVDVSLGIFGTEVLVAATANGPDDSDCSVACPDDDQVGWLLLTLQ